MGNNPKTLNGNEDLFVIQSIFNHVFFTGSGAVGHGEEQNYIFNRWYSADIPDNSDFSKFPEADVTVHYRFMSLFTNFIKEL